jgi:hypothetical protein
MGKRSKGVDAVIQKNMLKKAMLSSCKKYAEQLEKENYALKNDPGTVIGQFIAQFRELYSQNQRLSTLAAALIKMLGDKVVLPKEEMESYNGKRINIKWEIADGETIETAKEFTFTYELQDAPPQGQPVQTTETPGEHVHDENCNHEEAVTVSNPDYKPAIEEIEVGDTVLVNGEEATVTAVNPTDGE